MTVQNQSFWGVLKGKFNFGENTRDFLAKVPLTTTEMELGYYHHRWKAQVAPLVALRS